MYSQGGDSVTNCADMIWLLGVYNTYINLTVYLVEVK